MVTLILFKNQVKQVKAHGRIRSAGHACCGTEAITEMESAGFKLRSIITEGERTLITFSK